MTAMESAAKAVEELEASRDTVFGLERDEKLKKMAEAVLEIVPKADSLTDAVERAAALSIRGRAMGVIPAEFRDSKECDTLLSKSVKMNPKCVSTWNALGHLRWEQSKLKDALAAYEGGLESVPTNKIALRNSALILRSIGGKANIEKAVERSKAALATDFSDGMSWYTHGMVHLSKYFSWTFSQADLRAALKAFNLSDKQCESCNPDVAFNRGQCQQYMILWQEALEGISKAIEIDPTFTEAIKAKETIETFFETVTRKWNCYAGYNEKTLAKLIKSLPQTGTKTLRGNSIEVLPLSSLEATEGCVAEAKGVVVKILECIDNSSMPIYYLACDHTRQRCLIACYGIASSSISSGQEIVYGHPAYYKRTVPGKEPWECLVLVVDRSSLVTVGGRLLEKSQWTSMELTVTAKAD